jgi:hypothetical protein
VNSTRSEKRPAGRRPLLTEELQQRICAFIRAGAYDYAAAEANGINRRTFFDWLQRSEGTSKRKQSQRYVQFAHAVRAAQAECRVTAEIEVRRADPKWWLTSMCRSRICRAGLGQARRLTAERASVTPGIISSQPRTHQQPDSGQLQYSPRLGRAPLAGRFGRFKFFPDSVQRLLVDPVAR